MVQLSCGVQCTRIILFILNILFLICGCMLLGFGIYVKVSKKFDIAFSEHINTQIVGGTVIEWVGVTMIIVAVFTIVLSAFGCLGAVFKNRAFLYLYAVILTLLIIAEIGAFIATFSSRVHIRDSYEYGLRSLFIEIYKKNETELKYVIEDVEREFQCCGVYNVTDYYQNNFTVPAACHEDENFQKPIFNKGCARAAIEWVWNQFPIIGGTLGGVLLIEIFGVVSSIALGIAISHSNYDKLYH